VAEISARVVSVGVKKSCIVKDLIKVNRHSGGVRHDARMVDAALQKRLICITRKK